MPGLARRLAGAAICLLLAGSAISAASPEPDAVISFPVGSEELSATDHLALQQLAAKALV